jgi:hypothetical protein
MRVIFLDIDGVLNSRDFMGESPPMSAFGGADEELMDPAAVERLNTIIDQTDAHVVISSSWRFQYDYTQMGEMLTKRGFRHADKIIDQTTRDGQGFRGHEVQTWLDMRREQVIVDPKTEPITSYVILDDSGDFNPDQQANFVHTKFQNGLTQADVQRAISILGRG